MFEEGIRYAPESSTKLNIYANDPRQMFGSPITTDIFLSPQKQAAHEFKQQMVEFNDNNNQPMNYVSMLINELRGLTADEKEQPAYYGGASAMEEYHNASGLVPYENRENAEALVQPNPALIDLASNDKIQLLVIITYLCEYLDAKGDLVYKEEITIHQKDDVISFDMSGFLNKAAFQQDGKIPAEIKITGNSMQVPVNPEPGMTMPDANIAMSMEMGNYNQLQN